MHRVRQGRRQKLRRIAHCGIEEDINEKTGRHSTVEPRIIASSRSSKCPLRLCFHVFLGEVEQQT